MSHFATDGYGQPLAISHYKDQPKRKPPWRQEEPTEVVFFAVYGRGSVLNQIVSQDVLKSILSPPLTNYFPPGP